MNGPGHDAADGAARYLAGELSPEERRAFEAHMMSCDACWTEMATAREGRGLAESLRESAPQSARELLRTIAAAPPDGARSTRPARWFHTAGSGRRAAAAVLVILVAAGLTGVVTLLTGRSADPLRAAAAEYQVRSSQEAGTGARPPVARIGDLVWTGTDHKTIGDQPATLYRYADAQGEQVVLISSTQSFPRADNAQNVGAGPEWIADVDGATMLCADADGLSWLVVAGSRDEAISAGAAVGFA